MYELYNYMFGVKYISYLTPTMSDNIIFSKLVFCLALWNYGRIMIHEYKHEILD